MPTLKWASLAHTGLPGERANLEEKGGGETARLAKVVLSRVIEQIEQKMRQ